MHWLHFVKMLHEDSYCISDMSNLRHVNSSECILISTMPTLVKAFSHIRDKVDASKNLFDSNAFNLPWHCPVLHLFQYSWNEWNICTFWKPQKLCYRGLPNKALIWYGMIVLHDTMILSSVLHMNVYQRESIPFTHFKNIECWAAIILPIIFNPF